MENKSNIELRIFIYCTTGQKVAKSYNWGKKRNHKEYQEPNLYFYLLKSPLRLIKDCYPELKIISLPGFQMHSTFFLPKKYNFSLR